MVVACSRKEKDVVVDCLLWLLQSLRRVLILSCRSHTNSSSRNNTTMANASSTWSCYNLKRNKKSAMLQFIFIANTYYAHLFMRESLLCDVLLHIGRLDSVFGNALQNATQLFFDRIPQTTKYCIMRECENILRGYLYDGDLVFVILKGFFF